MFLFLSIFIHSFYVMSVARNIDFFIEHLYFFIFSNISVQNNLWTQVNCGNGKKHSRECASICDLIENIHFQEKELAQNSGSNLCYNSNFGEDIGELQTLNYQQKMHQVQN